MQVEMDALRKTILGKNAGCLIEKNQSDANGYLHSSIKQMGRLSDIRQGW